MELRWDTVRRDEFTFVPVEAPSEPRGGKYDNSRVKSKRIIAQISDLNITKTIKIFKNSFTENFLEFYSAYNRFVETFMVKL